MIGLKNLAVLAEPFQTNTESSSHVFQDFADGFRRPVFLQVNQDRGFGFLALSKISSKVGTLPVLNSRLDEIPH